jgi:DHA1 family tetracycline resistance protein-like MFS transporter
MLVMLLVVFVDLLGFGVIIPLLPYYGEHFNASPAMITTLLSTYSAMQLISGPFWGRLSDRIGRRPVILVSVTASMLAYLWLSSADALWMLFAARALQGLGGGNISVAQAYIADVTTPANRSKGMGGLGAALGFGFVIGPALGGFLSGSDPEHINAAAPSLVSAAFSGLALLLALTLLKESLSPALRGQAGKGPGRLTQIRQAFSRPRLRILMILFFSTTFAFAGMETTFALFADHRLNWGPERVGWIFAVVGVIGVVIQGGLIGRITKRYGEARTLFFGTIGIAIGLALLALATEPVLTIVASCWLAAGMGLAQPSTSSLISQEAGAAEQGGVLGVNQSVGSFGRIIGPAVAGQAFEWGGPSLPYIIGAAVMVLAASIAFQVARRRDGASAAFETGA